MGLAATLPELNEWTLLIQSFITYVLIQSFIKQLTLAVKQCFLHACNKSDYLQLRPEAAIILQFLRCLGNVTSWNIRLYFFLRHPVYLFWVNPPSSASTLLLCYDDIKDWSIDLLPMSSCIATRWLVHNGGSIQKLFSLLNWLETSWFGRLCLVTKVFWNFSWTYFI